MHLFNLGHRLPLILGFKGIMLCDTYDCEVAVTAGDPYWDKDKACGKAFFLINIQPQSKAPPTQALVTSGLLWAHSTDPSCLYCFS